MQARHISKASRAIMAFGRGRLSPSHEIMTANDWEFRSVGEVNFLSQYSSYFSRLKELGVPWVPKVSPAYGLCLSVFLSSPGKMFCTDHFSL